MSNCVSIIGLLAAIVNLGRALINRISRPTARQRAARAVHDARAASARGDARAVNATTERTRVNRQLLVIMPLLLLLAGCGCSLLKPKTTETPKDPPPKVVVVPADRLQYPMTNEQGVAGWFVPAAVHAEFLEAVVLVDYYRSQKGNTK